MNKNNYFDKRSPANQEQQVHPVWRGIGLILMVFIPVLSFLASSVILDLNNQYGWFMIPSELFLGNQPKLTFYLSKVGIFISDQLILAKLALTAAVSFVVYAVFTLITFLMNRMFGPPRYQVPDVPPLRRRSR